MIEKIGPVRNPLTIIAMFAGIAEISGTVVLPFVDKANQLIYIWFLIGFPTLLVLLFFGTLNLNHKVLYAPSDFEDEDNFFRDASPAEVAAKVERELQAPRAASVAPGAKQSSPDVAFEGTSAAAAPSYAWARDLVFGKLSAELSMPIRRGVRGTKSDGRWYVFDGIVYYRVGTTAVEFKYVVDPDLLAPLTAARVREVQDVWEMMSERGRSSFGLILAIGTNARLSTDNHLLDSVRKSLTSVPFPVEIKLFDLEKLATAAGPTA